MRKLTDFFSVLRVYQWLKNLLIFVPLFAAHQINNFQFLIILIIAFISFSLCASSIYIINDLLDLKYDRKHPRKKNRPFASNKFPVWLGLAMIPFLIGLSFALGILVSMKFLFILLAYLLITILYSLVIKRFVLIDCFTLSILYTIRIIAGAIAVSLSISFWLLAFSIFIFLSLALVKRYAELIFQIQEGKSISNGRGYQVSDASLLRSLGVSSGYISALVIALYLQSDQILTLYINPEGIWFIIPLILFWVSWIWLKATRGDMDDDPIIFAIKDKISLIVALLVTIVFFYASYGF